MTIAIIILSILCAAAFAAFFSVQHKYSDAKLDSARALERLGAAESNLASLKIELETVKAQRNEAVDRATALTHALAKAESEIARLQESLRLHSESHAKEIESMKQHQQEILEQTEDRFRVMANEIMSKQSETMRTQNEERLVALLNPLKENIESFRKEVNSCYNAEARERNTLQEKIKDLIEANNNIGKEARELANALKGNSKKQGDWGEMILETILEKSGLRRDEEFFVQQQTDEEGSVVRNEAGRMLRPDVIVNYPGGKKIIIDSKVSLTAFIDYVNTDNPVEQKRLGDLHLASVVKHINELSDKNYQKYIGREQLDFVMMFIPNESAYAAAITLDPSLWQKAYDKRVLVVSPTQLVGSLRLIKQLWNTQHQTENAIEIATRSGQLYDKFVGFITDMEKIKKGLNGASAAYDAALNKLSQGRGNLVSRAESLKKLGIKAEKAIPSAYTDSAFELPDTDETESDQ